MKPFPHHYSVAARATPGGSVPISSAGLAELETAPPPDFDGPGGLWSPENFLVAAVADCFVLTFRSVARAGKLAWERLECTTEGVLDRAAGVTQFTRFSTQATLIVPPGTDLAKARDLLERAEKLCLIANSLRGERHLDARVVESAG